MRRRMATEAVHFIFRLSREDRMSRTAEEVGYQADVQGNMIEQHERRLRELEKQHLFSLNIEAENHRARWLGTYNAVRGGMEAATQELLDVDDAHEYAAAAADRVHGPLEAKAPEFKEGLGTFGPPVELTALVKAAGRLYAFVVGEHPDWSEEGPVVGIVEALKPFEGVS